MFKYSVSVDTIEPMGAVERRVWVSPIARDVNGARTIAKQHVMAVYPDLHIVRVHAWTRGAEPISFA
jgi:hypothetical protein